MSTASRASGGGAGGVSTRLGNRVVAWVKCRDLIAGAQCQCSLWTGGSRFWSCTTYAACSASLCWQYAALRPGGSHPMCCAVLWWCCACWMAMQCGLVRPWALRGHLHQACSAFSTSMCFVHHSHELQC